MKREGGEKDGGTTKECQKAKAYIEPVRRYLTITVDNRPRLLYLYPALFQQHPSQPPVSKTGYKAFCLHLGPGTTSETMQSGFLTSTRHAVLRPHQLRSLSQAWTLPNEFAGPLSSTLLHRETPRSLRQTISLYLGLMSNIQSHFERLLIDSSPTRDMEPGPAGSS